MKLLVSDELWAVVEPVLPTAPSHARGGRPRIPNRAVLTGILGHPRRRPAKLHGDKGYDKPHCRRYCQRYHIGCRLARIGIESSDRLGRHRWVVERTLAWLGQFRRLTIRYERRLDIHQAFLTLACSLMCWNFVRRFC